MKLSAKMLIFIVLLLLGVGMGSAFWAAQIMFTSLQQGHRASSQSLVQVLGEPLSYTVMQNQPIAATEILKGIVSSSDDILYVHIIGFDGKTFASATKEGFTPEQFLHKNWEEYAKGTPGLKEREWHSQGRSIREFSLPLIRGLPAHVHFGMDETHLKAQIGVLEKRIASFTLIVIVFGVLVSIFFTHKITRPIRYLSTKMRAYGKREEISSLNLSCLPCGIEEIDALGQDFQRMADARNEVETSLEEAKQRLQSIVANIPGLIYRVFLNERSYIHFLNDMLYPMTGYTGEELQQGTHCPIEEYILPEDRKKVIRIVDEALARNCPFEVEYCFVRKDGEVRYFMEYGRPSLGPDGKPAYIDGVIFDVTDRQKSEQERERLIGELERKNFELEQFTYTVSHDLKTPLISIGGLLSLSERALVAGDIGNAQKYMARIPRAVEGMNGILTSLLMLSRVGRVSKPEEDVGFVDLVIEVKGFVEVKLVEKNINLTIMPDMPTVRVDRARMVSVVQNLVENAIKYMGDQPEPRVEIGFREGGEPGQMIFYVKDNGIGIDPAYEKKIFGVFEQLDPQYDGMGIGLNLVTRVVESHGGRVWVESQGEGHGSTFCFTLPIAS
ncbi:MAG: PAS domain-containing protein [Candidatus Omnitrophica bacterium]|nr:PAS domain-containing protein [Candidatus Omnitrophota bacterium]